MKITRRQLRRIIKEYGAPGDRGLGWADFQAMAQIGDYEGAGGWLQQLAQDRGLRIDRDIEDMMIEMGADENLDAEDMELEWRSYMGDEEPGEPEEVDPARRRGGDGRGCH